MRKIFVSRKHKLHKIWKRLCRSETWKSVWLSSYLLFFNVFGLSITCSIWVKLFFSDVSPLQSSTRTDHHSKTGGAMTSCLEKTGKPTIIKKVLQFVWNYWLYVRIYSKSWLCLTEFGDLFWLGRSHWRRTHWLPWSLVFWLIKTLRWVGVFIKPADFHSCIFIKNNLLLLNISEN